MNRAWRILADRKKIDIIEFEKMVILFCVLNHTYLRRMRPRLTFRYGDYHAKRRRGRAEHTAEVRSVTK